ncbi:hypothetical protein C1I95_24580 [Micromonospora craterilacus]|uniref:Uncharacterized protein n=1 Tax=Micromonospora craterilacus TaxID=1655439 RepID=A0A2W2EKV3_9ACTN|nr:hypothetical protein C1I95_24580 [Micromonospora craterilacus]
MEATGNCRELHSIEVRDGQQWVPLHIAQASRILATSVGQMVDTLIKVHGGWSADAAARADATAEPGTDEWRNALGPHEDATLTADGRPAATGGWCTCPAVGDDEWVRYERWSARGREAHGYVHAGCRALVQAG